MSDIGQAGHRLLGLPPQSFFVVSAVFHYLGPAFAVLLFAHLDVLGVAWLRITAAAALFAVWRRPWRLLTGMGRGRGVLLGQSGPCCRGERAVLSRVARLRWGRGAIESGWCAVGGRVARSPRKSPRWRYTVAVVAALADLRLAAAARVRVRLRHCTLFMRSVLGPVSPH